MLENLLDTVNAIHLQQFQIPGAVFQSRTFVCLFPDTSAVPTKAFTIHMSFLTLIHKCLEMHFSFFFRT